MSVKHESTSSGAFSANCASPPPKRQVSVTMPVASAPFAVAETCRQAVMSVDSLPGGPQAPRDVDRARLEETLRGRLRRARM